MRRVTDPKDDYRSTLHVLGFRIVNGKLTHPALVGAWKKLTGEGAE